MLHPKKPKKLIKVCAFSLFCATVIPLPLNASEQDWQDFARQTNSKLQTVINERFTQDLRQVESDMRHEMELFIGPYHGIQREILLQFIQEMRQRDEIITPRS
ncbi:MAG: hypothetical protein ACOH5I_14445 [Oligoflexus sp.]